MKIFGNQFYFILKIALSSPINISTITFSKKGTYTVFAGNEDNRFLFTLSVSLLSPLSLRLLTCNILKRWYHFKLLFNSHSQRKKKNNCHKCFCLLTFNTQVVKNKCRSFDFNWLFTFEQLRDTVRNVDMNTAIFAVFSQ